MSDARKNFTETYRVEPHSAVVEDGEVDSEEGLQSTTAVLVTPALTPAIATRLEMSPLSISYLYPTEWMIPWKGSLVSSLMVMLFPAQDAFTPTWNSLSSSF